MKNILEIITGLSKGVDVSTGEVFDWGEYRGNPEIKEAIKELQRAFNGKSRKVTYKKYEEEYPGYIIVKKEGYFYSAHNDSAVKLAEIMGYRTGTDAWGRISTGSPSVDKIKETLVSKNCKFIIVENGEISYKNEEGNYNGNV